MVTERLKEKPGYGQTVLALVGGFSAQVVYQVLKWIADIFLAAVQGSDRDVIAARTEAAKAKAESRATEEMEQQKAKLRAPLDEAHEAAMNAGATDVVEKLKKAKKELS